MGPATDDDEVLKDLMRSGMDIARLNFSHGDHEEPVSYTHLDVYKRQIVSTSFPSSSVLNLPSAAMR